MVYPPCVSVLVRALPLCGSVSDQEYLISELSQEARHMPGLPVSGRAKCDGTRKKG
ncbi:hypothetical protein MARHY2134 [Marinobacter nauticus ATCC 49840]|nr:hypothetical protein MARHY2134 [Marinobacter nauticus ATCC 49840]